MAGTLYIVATPIGNLEDITLRALRTLKEVQLIAAEDTRHTQKLLSHYDIHTPLTSYHEHNERTKTPALVERLQRGESIALVTDAGTPTISDPGYRLVAAAVAAGVQVTPVPGPAALIAALSGAGLPTDRFVFEGFLPEKKSARRRALESLKREPRTLVFYEAPHRLKAALEDIGAILGERPIVIARELSKIHEEFLRGQVSEIRAALAQREIRGEVVVMVHGAAGEREIPEESLRDEIRELRANGLRVREIADRLGAKYGYSRRQIYRTVLDSEKIKREEKLADQR